MAKNGEFLTKAGKALFRWVTMLLGLLAYFGVRKLIGWDETMNWSRFSDLAALGTLILFLLVVYRIIKL